MANQDFLEKTISIVLQIPKGKATTYGHIAKAIGAKSSARLVGWALNSIKNRDEIPCHRVLNRQGFLTGRLHFITPQYMQEALESEGIEVIDNRVDLDRYLWIPDNIVDEV